MPVTAGVRIVPGLTALTVMRRGASSMAPRRERWITAAFDVRVSRRAGQADHAG